MKSFRELDKIVDIVIKHNLPRNITMFMNRDEKLETDIFLNNLSSSGVNSFLYPNTELECDKLSYGGVIFYIISTDNSEQETLKF